MFLLVEMKWVGDDLTVGDMEIGGIDRRGYGPVGRPWRWWVAAFDDAAGEDGWAPSEGEARDACWAAALVALDPKEIY